MMINTLANKNENITKQTDCPTPSEYHRETAENAKRVGLVCPNCGADLEGRKCKLVCVRVGCGYVVTCSEW